MGDDGAVQQETSQPEKSPIFSLALFRFFQRPKGRLLSNKNLEFAAVWDWSPSRLPMISGITTGVVEVTLCSISSGDCVCSRPETTVQGLLNSSLEILDEFLSLEDWPNMTGYSQSRALRGMKKTHVTSNLTTTNWILDTAPGYIFGLS